MIIPRAYLTSLSPDAIALLWIMLTYACISELSVMYRGDELSDYMFIYLFINFYNYDESLTDKVELITTCLTSLDFVLSDSTIMVAAEFPMV